MKPIERSNIYFVLLFIFLFSYGNQTSGQGKVNISAGIGLPELINFGIRYQFRQEQVGICIGTVPLRDEKLLSISGDLYFHFGEVAELSARRVWYAKVGLNYLSDEFKNSEDRWTYLNLRFGRDINISKNIGFEIDLGTLIQLLHKEIPPSTGWDLNFPILPSFGINIFFRL